MAKTITYKCNMCGKDLDFNDISENFSIEQKLGYGMKYDGSTLRLDFCCSCMDKLIEQCKICPVVEAHIW